MRWGRRAEAAASAATLPRTAIDLADVAHAYGDRPVLADVSVTLTERRVDEVLVRYGLGGHRDHPAHLLSGGQKQLLAIAGVLVMHPQRIVFDEPTTLLDLANTRRVSRVIDELEQDVVVVTHHLDSLDGFDRVLVFEGGRLVADGSPGETVPWYAARMG